MSKLFDPPAGLREFKHQSSYSSWSDTIGSITDQAIQHNNIDFWDKKPNPEYYNPVHHPAGSDKKTADVTWSAFPQRISSIPVGDPDAYKQADTNDDTMNRYLKDEIKKDPSFNKDHRVRCQDEYCEWFVHRDPAGKITAVDITAEGPELYDFMFDNEPELLLELYHQYVSKDVKLEDLSSIDKHGKKVYNIYNDWNTLKGAMHLQCPPNSLFAEIVLGAEATVIRTGADGKPLHDPTTLIDCSAYGVSTRSSDPTIGFAVNKAVQAGARVTIANPVGLYIKEVDPLMPVMSYQRDGDSEATPLTSDQFAKIFVRQRGDKDSKNNQGLRYRCEVPAGFGFKTSDLVINGQKLEWGSQLAEYITIGLTAETSKADAPYVARDYCYPRPVAHAATAARTLVTHAASVPTSAAIASEGSVAPARHHAAVPKIKHRFAHF